jgi:hypothetical protein
MNQQELDIIADGRFASKADAKLAVPACRLVTQSRLVVPAGPELADDRFYDIFYRQRQPRRENVEEPNSNKGGRRQSRLE